MDVRGGAERKVVNGLDVAVVLEPGAGDRFGGRGDGEELEGDAGDVRPCIGDVACILTVRQEVELVPHCRYEVSDHAGMRARVR